MNKARISVSDEETMGSRSKSLLITLMTLLSVTLIIVVFALGVGGQNDNLEGSAGTVYIGSPIVLSLDGLESNDVSVPLKCEATGIDTEEGYIKVCEAYIDDVLPLCVKDETVSDWYVIYASCGGYFPVGGVAQLIQKDGCHGNLNLIVDDTFDSSTYEPPCGCGGLDCCCCGVEFYKIIFDVDKECICLDSNHLPSNPEVDESACVGCEDFNCWITTPPECTLQKEVKLTMWEDWMGCESPDQSFEVMLAHKSCFHEFPPELIFIASKKKIDYILTRD